MQFFTLNNDKFLNKVILAWAILASAALLYHHYDSYQTNGDLSANAFANGKTCPYKWNGGNPLFKGSCWCGWDNYCMCTPSLAIDAIIEVAPSSLSPLTEPSIVLIERRDPPKNIYAIPGGFVNIGETVEAATRREAKEETNIDVDHDHSISQFRIYSDPKRDKRRHTVSAVMRCLVGLDTISKRHKGDDAKKVEVVPLSKALSLPLAFDHKQIIADYIARYHPNLLKSD